MSELIGIVRFTFHPGMVEEYKRLSAEAMAIVRTQEPDTLQFDTYFDADETRAVVIERYRDSDALVAHSEHMAPLMEPLMATGDVEGELLGDLSPDLAEKMAGSPVGLLTLYSSKQHEDAYHGAVALAAAMPRLERQATVVGGGAGRSASWRQAGGCLPPWARGRGDAALGATSDSGGFEGRDVLRRPGDRAGRWARAGASRRGDE
jgi:quinol monooxygenase YgiN